jgi:uncharacterized membrane protein
MNRMLVVIFNNQSDAYKGRQALQELDQEGSITAYNYAVIAKKPDGTSTIEEGSDGGPVGTLAGTSLGSLIGLLGGPAGLAIGATTGMLAGIATDLRNARIDGGFVDDVSRQMTPGRVALVADIQEDWTTPLDTRMEELGGVVLRRTVSEVRDTLNAEDIAAMKADLAQMRAEHAQSKADRQAKLSEKVNQLETKLQQRLQKAREQREANEKEVQAHANLLAAKAAKASTAAFSGAPRR